MRRIFRLGRGHADVERDVDDELAFHLEMRAQKLRALGLSPEDARREALRQFGDLERTRSTMVTTDHERERTMRRTTVFQELRQDLWQAGRMLRLHPAFSITIVVMLALGIGANTGIFTLVDAVLLRTLPVRAPEELVVIGDPGRPTSFSSSDTPFTEQISYPLYTEIRSENRVFADVVATGRADRLDVQLERTAAGEPERPRGRYVSANYFQVLGVGAQLGRVLDANDDASVGNAPVVVISHAYWMRRFAGNRDVIGRSIAINGQGFSIIGVTSSAFSGEVVGGAVDMWLPLAMHDVVNPNRRLLEDRNSHWLLLMGRLRPGTTLATAHTEITSLVRRLYALHPPASSTPDQFASLDVQVSSGARGLSRVRASFATPLLTLMAGVVLLLLIVCANVSNLLLARAVSRQREMTVRVAIGAGRSRLMRQLLTESLVLALLGALAGLAVAWYASHLLLVLVSGSSSTAIPLDLRLDLRVLGFTMLASVAAVALFGLAPALAASRVDLASAMRAHARSVTAAQSSRSISRLRGGQLLITGQVALSLVLLVGAALLVRSLRHIQQTDTGLDRDHLLIVDVDVESRGYTAAQAQEMTRQFADRILRIPGARAVTLSENGIFSGTESATTLQVAGFTARTADDSVANYDYAGPGYVQAIGARLLRGREFGPGDVAGAERVAMINESMARFYFGERNPLGEYLRFNDSLAVRIVGVVADVKDHSLEGEPVPRFYLAYFQDVFGGPGSLRLEVRSVGDPAALITPVREAIRAADPLLRIDRVDPLPVLMQQSIRGELLLARLSSVFGSLALLLAAFGLYGVLTYAVTRRAGEIGLRVALGAQRTSVVRMILGDALFLVGIGALIGVPLSIAGGRLLSNQLHGIGGIDVLSIGVALVTLVASAVLAALLPALRASRVAPLTALREE